MNGGHYFSTQFQTSMDNKKTILVVDDDEQTRVQIRRKLMETEAFVNDTTVYDDGLDKLRSCMGVLGLDLDGMIDNFMPHHTVRPVQKCVLEECQNETQHNGGCCCAEHLYEVKKRQRALRK